MTFTAFVSDVFSRRIVGWRTAASMPTGLPLDALEMALWIRARTGQDVDGLVHHSDAGAQYTSIRYTNRLLDAGAVASIGTVGDSFDNALVETVVGLYKTECVRQQGLFRGVDDLELATADWVSWFNTSRLHSALNYLPPVDYEAATGPATHRRPEPCALLRRQRCADARCRPGRSSSRLRRYGGSTWTAPARRRDWQLRNNAAH